MLSKFLDIMASGLSGVNLSGEVEDRDRWEIEHFKGEPAVGFFGGVLKDYRYGGYVKIYDRDLPEEEEPGSGLGRYEWPAGELDYSYEKGVVTVEQLEVDGAYQRMGIATLMFEVLDKAYGYENVVPHQLNEESKLLRANLDAKYGTFHLDNYLEWAEEEDDLSGVNLSGEEEGDWYVVWLEDFANALDFDGVQDIASLDYYDWERTGPNRRFRTEKAHYAAWFFDRIASRTTSPEQWFIRYDTLSNYPGGERVFDQMAARKIVPAEGRYYDIIRTSVSEYAYDKFKTHCLNTGTMMLLIQDFPQERKYFVNDACNIPGDRGGFSARWEEERQRNFTGRRWDQDYADEWTSKAKEGLGLDDDWTAPTAAWDEVKALQLLRKLAIVYHPDKGGSTETMQIINNAFDQQDMELLEAYADEAGLSGVSLGDVIRLYGQGPSVKDEIEKIIEEIEKDGGEVYFRVSSQDDDLQGASVEYPDISRQEAAVIWGVDVDGLDEELDAMWLYYDDHQGGVFWDGICVSPDIESMAHYYRDQMGAGIGDGKWTEGLYLYLITGDYITDTLVGDGEVVQNARLVKRFDASVLSEWFDTKGYSGLGNINLSGEVEDRDRWEVITIWPTREGPYGDEGKVLVYDRHQPGFPDTRPVGRIAFDDGYWGSDHLSASIRALDVRGEYRRMGIATLMFEVLDNRYGYDNIYPADGELTPDAISLRQDMDRKYGTSHMRHYLSEEDLP